MKRFTLEDIKRIFLENNCILLADNYIDNSQPLHFRCFCGKEDTKNLATFKKCSMCRYCSLEVRSAKKRKSFDEIKEIFKSKGNKLLSTEYIPGEKLKYICDCGKVDYKIIYKFIAGERCQDCGLKKSANSRRFDQKFVESFFEKYDCKLISEYLGDELPLIYICKCGKEAKSNFHTFKKCKNCRECGMKKNILDTKIIDKFIEENNLNLVSFHTFENTSKGKLLLRCKCGKEYERAWNYLKYRKGNNVCEECSKKIKMEKLTGENHPNWIKDRTKVEFRKQYARKIYSMLRRCYQKFNLKKESKSYESLGYSQYDLGYHITNHPNYQNAIKNKDMHIDHIFPIQAFIDFGLCEIEHIKIINSLENLQPLDSFDNSSKSDKYDKEEFIKFLQLKGLY